HAPGFDRYRGVGEQIYVHEAGLDAWMTGVAYLRVMYQISKNRQNMDAFLAELGDNEDVNRLYLPNWEASFNVASLQEIPDFDNVFYVSDIPSGTTTGGL